MHPLKYHPDHTEFAEHLNYVVKNIATNSIGIVNNQNNQIS